VNNLLDELCNTGMEVDDSVKAADGTLFLLLGVRSGAMSSLTELMLKEGVGKFN
jgi:hypothetical protein